MKKILNLHIEEFDHIDELTDQDRELLQKAGEICDNAYAPYSKYHVGAAVLLDNGKVVQGSNQENVAYPSGLCAERVALFYASSKYPNAHVVSVAITARAGEFTIDHPVSPCGSCRQVMAEYENKQASPIRVILRGETGVIQRINGIGTLLPLAFHADELKK